MANSKKKTAHEEHPHGKGAPSFYSLLGLSTADYRIIIDR